MPSGSAVFHALTSEDFDKIKLLGAQQSCKQGDLIFSDGDSADYIYFIESGSVSIFIEKFTHQEEISALGPGEYFGEMAFFSGDRRSASATALSDTTLLGVGKPAFMRLLETDHGIAGKINHVLSRRNEELSIKEQMTGNSGNGSFLLGIKGDPSLRFSAFSRERYDSVVDRIMADLQPHLYELLVNRSAYEIFIHCNSGEVHIRTVHDPFGGDIHPAAKLLNIAYIERHFPVIDYEAKSSLIRNLYRSVCSADFSGAPEHLKEEVQVALASWQPVPPHKLAATLSKLFLLRKIPNFYMRNFSISAVRDVIRMQFNCDGTQIVNAQGFQSFLEDNLDPDEVNAVPSEERRVAQRRSPSQQMARSAFHHGERRSPAGRRQEDWASLTGDDFAM